MNLEKFAPDYQAARQKRNMMRLGLQRRAYLVGRHIREGASVLDVGAADGAMLSLLAPRKKLSRLVNLEGNPELARAIPENAVCASGLKIPFSEGSFDNVICSATRKHVPDAVGLAKEMARVLKAGGRLIVVDPHPLMLWLGRAVGKFDRRYLHHFSFAGDICADMEKAGLKPIYHCNGLFVCCVAEKPAIT